MRLSTECEIERLNRRVMGLSQGRVYTGQTTIDFGALPLAAQTFTVTDANSTLDALVIAQAAYVAPAGKDLDELEMDNLSFTCNGGVGEFTMRVNAVDGSYLADKFVINYLIG